MTLKKVKQRKTWRKGRTPKKQRLNVLRGKLMDCFEFTYKGEKKPFCDGMSKLIGPKKSKIQRSTKNAQNLLEEIVLKTANVCQFKTLLIPKKTTVELG